MLRREAGGKQDPQPAGLDEALPAHKALAGRLGGQHEDESLPIRCPGLRPLAPWPIPSPVNPVSPLFNIPLPCFAPPSPLHLFSSTPSTLCFPTLQTLSTCTLP